jgi:LemA protein
MASLHASQGWSWLSDRVHEEGEVMVWVLVGIGVVVVVVGLYVVAFNKLRRQDVAVQEALGGIDVQLTRRADLIPNLVSTVKGYAAHEQGVLEEVTAARTRVQAAARGGSVEERAVAEAGLDRALVNVMAVAESYPELKASTNFVQLQDQLADTENHLALARRGYNDAVSRLNTTASTIPWMFFAGAAGVSKQEFYEAPEVQQAPPTVQF